MIHKLIFHCRMQIRQMAIYSFIFFLLMCAQLEKTAGCVSEKADDAIDKAYSECLEKSGGVTLDMRNCMSEAYGKWDVALNEAYQKIMKTLNQDGKKHLRDSQKAWIKFRDAEFEFIGNLPEQGTASLLVRDESRLEIVKNRVMELRKRLSKE